MFEYIQGILIKYNEGILVVDVGGIGYKIQTPSNLSAQLPPLFQKVQLYLSTVIRPESHQLYGFLSEEERDLFETLISLSGIGPKTALNILSYLGLEGLYIAVQREDLQAFIQVPGIGKKTAERLLIDLRGRTSLPKNTSSSPSSNLVHDGIKALMNLGYSHSKAEQAIKSAVKNVEDGDLTTLITAALKSKV